MPNEGERLGHGGSPVSPFTMLEKVAECRDTKILSCSSRLQMPGSMSQDRMPVGGKGGGGRRSEAGSQLGSPAPAMCQLTTIWQVGAIPAPSPQPAPCTQQPGDSEPPKVPLAFSLHPHQGTQSVNLAFHREGSQHQQKSPHLLNSHLVPSIISPPPPLSHSPFCPARNVPTSWPLHQLFPLSGGPSLCLPTHPLGPQRFASF